MIICHQFSVKPPFNNFLLAALSLLLATSALYPQSSKEKLGVIVEYLNKVTYPEFSGVVLLEMNDSILFHKAYGYESLDYDVKNGFDTRFNIASITKTMTAVAVLQLVDKGKLNLEASVGSYLPDYPNRKVRDSVTTHQLLTHTSGLDNFLVEDYKGMEKSNLRHVSDYLPLFASKPLHILPGV